MQAYTSIVIPPASHKQENLSQAQSLKAKHQQTAPKVKSCTLITSIRSKTNSFEILLTARGVVAGGSPSALVWETALVWDSAMVRETLPTASGVLTGESLSVLVCETWSILFACAFGIKMNSSWTAAADVHAWAHERACVCVCMWVYCLDKYTHFFVLVLASWSNSWKFWVRYQA